MKQSSTTQRKRLFTLVSVGLMAALVFAGNYMQFKIPVSIGDITRVHLGNSMCLLAGLLFGPMAGGLASGIGAGLFDLFDPIYIISAPYTFCAKFAMGFLAGLIAKNAFQRQGKSRIGLLITAAISGQLAYIALYLLKSYVSLRLVGTEAHAAFIAVIPKILTSSINAVAAIVISVPLSLALRKALSHTSFFSTAPTAQDAPAEKKGYLNPLTIGLTIFCCIVTLVFSLYLSSSSKIKKEEQAKFDALQQLLDQYKSQLDYLAEQLDITLPVPEAES